MSEYLHHVSGFFANHDEANVTLSRLIERGIACDRIKIFTADANSPSVGPPTASGAVLKDVLVDGVIGTVVGTGLGGLAEVALVAGSASLFVASPLIAPLIMLGWGASLGAFIGSSIGASADGGIKHGKLADIVGDAISQGQVVLVAETRTEQETAVARDVIRVAVGVSTDVNAV